MTMMLESDASVLTEMEILSERVRSLEAAAIEHEREHAQLLEDHSFREGVIRRAAEGICVCHAISDYPFVEFTVWNPRMIEITGYSIDDINRLGWYQTMYPDPETQERARRRMGEMRDGMDLQYERWEVVRADGERRTLGISTSLLTSSDGLTHALALMQDVTEEDLHRKGLEGRLLKLEGILPICAQCKKIRDDQGVWHQLESYIKAHSGAQFTHGVCVDCAAELFPGTIKHRQDPG